MSKPANDIRGKQITPYTSIQLYPELHAIIRDRDPTYKGRAAEDFMLAYMKQVIPDFVSCRDEPNSMDLYSKAFKIRVEVKNILSTDDDLKLDCMHQFNRDCLVNNSNTNLFIFINVAYDTQLQTHIEDSPLRMFINGRDMNEHMLRVIFQTAANANKWSYTFDKVAMIQIGNPWDAYCRRKMTRTTTVNVNILPIREFVPKRVSNTSMSKVTPMSTVASKSPTNLTTKSTLKQTYNPTTKSPTTPKLRIIDQSDCDVTIKPHRYAKPDSYECNRMLQMLDKSNVRRIPNIQLKVKVKSITIPPKRKPMLEFKANVATVNIKPSIRKRIDTNGLLIDKRYTERPIRYKVDASAERYIYHNSPDCNTPIILCDANGYAYETLSVELIDRLHEAIHKNDKPKGFFDTVASWFDNAPPIVTPF